MPAQIIFEHDGILIFEHDGIYGGRILLHTGVEIPDAEEFLVPHLNRPLAVSAPVNPVSAVYEYSAPEGSEMPYWSHSTAFQAFMNSEVEPRLREIDAALRAWLSANHASYPDALLAVKEVSDMWRFIGTYIDLDSNKTGGELGSL